MPTHDSSRFLRTALKSNAVFSAVSGVTLVTASGPLATLIGLKYPVILIVVGISLFIFAATLVANAVREHVNRKDVWVAVALDIGWVLGSAIVLFAGVLTTTGNWMVAIVADIVLVFAILQFLGLRKVRRALAKA